jgi:hypothetical protein
MEMGRWAVDFAGEEGEPEVAPSLSTSTRGLDARSRGIARVNSTIRPLAGGWRTGMGSLGMLTGASAPTGRPDRTE